MKGGRRTTKGRIINMDDLIASAPHTTAVGNMKVNAQGDKLGKGGEVTATREQRTRAYYKDHPQSSNKKVSLKGDMKEAFADAPDLDIISNKTAQTARENVRTATTEAAQEDIPVVDEGAGPLIDNPELTEPEAPEPEEFDDVEMPPEEITDDLADIPEPDGYEEVHLPNGDIEMKPYWNNPDET